MKIRIDIIVFWVCAGLMVLFGALIPVWEPFAIFMGLFLTLSAGIYTGWQYIKYKRIDNNLEEMRYQDAYIYADENNTSFNPDEFRYSKKEERQINSVRRNAQISLIVGIGMVLIGLFVFIYACCTAV